MRYLYIVTNPEGKVYVGQTNNPIKRKHHYKCLKCKSQVMLYNSIIKYGWDKHTFTVICQVPEEYTDDAEIEYIKVYKSYYKYGGMNLTIGGRRMVWSDESRKRISDAILGSKNIRAKALYQYDQYGNFIKQWDCMKCMERELKFPTTAISNAIKRQSYYAYGYLWNYEETDFSTIEPTDKQKCRRKPL